MGDPVRGPLPARHVGREAGYVRWYTRVNAYALGLVDRYPPFSLSPSLSAGGPGASGAAPPPPPPMTATWPEAPGAQPPAPQPPAPSTSGAAGTAPSAPGIALDHDAGAAASSHRGSTCPSPGNAAYYVVPGRPGPAWGISSAGRAPGSHPGGQRFDSAMLHHFFLVPRSRGARRGERQTFLEARRQAAKGTPRRSESGQQPALAVGAAQGDPGRHRQSGEHEQDGEVHVSLKPSRVREGAEQHARRARP